MNADEIFDEAVGIAKAIREEPAYEYGVRYSTNSMDDFVRPEISLDKAEELVAFLETRPMTFFKPTVVRRPVVDWETIPEAYQPPPTCTFIPGGPKNSEGQLDPRPSCSCGAVMPQGIKTTPNGWFTGHTKYGWGKD